jgi:hypothetical protein
MISVPGALVSKVATVPAPTGGLDAFNSLAAMPPENAVALRNFIPAPYGCKIRKGFREHVTISGIGAISTLMVWESVVDNPATLGSEASLFAAAGKAIYNISTAGVAAVPLLIDIGTSPDTDRWQTTSVDRASAAYLYCVNGADDPVVITGPTTYKRLVDGDGTTEWTIKNVDPAKFVAVAQYRKYLVFVEKDSSRLWYLTPGALWGEAFQLDIGGWMNNGGYIVTVYSWSYNEVNLEQNRLVVITSAGEALVFAGDDLSALGTFNLIGAYAISAPLGRRCCERYAGDVIVLTEQGLVSISALANGSMAEQFPEGRSNMVQAPLVEAAQAVGNEFGWQLMYVPGDLTLIANPGGQSKDTSMQYVLNNGVTSWCTFSNMPALCWAVYYNDPFFALEDTIYHASTGHLDNVAADGTGGIQIIADVQQAFSNLGSAGLIKHMKLFKPTIISDSNISWVGKLNFDYSFEGTSGLNYAPDNRVALWDIALWDAQALWNTGNIVTNGWQTAVGVGWAVSLVLSIASSTECTWVSTDFVFESGGVF